MSPRSRRRSLQAPRRHRITRNAVVGFIDNSKPNFNLLADDLADLLVNRYGVAPVVKHRKLAASIPAPDAAYADIAEKCDLVITGSGD